MRIAVTTPTGHVGSAVADRLLAAGADVVLPVRNPDKVAPLVARGAEAVAGSLDDPDALTAATKGVDALFLVVPSDPTAPDQRASQHAFGEAGVHAIRANRIGRVVFLSSFGAQLESGTGPIRGLGDVERKLDGVVEHAVYLRPNVFMENTLGSIPTILEQRSIFAPVGGATTTDTIATRDVAERAAELLLDGAWTGRRVIELHGPETISFDRMAEIISAAFGEPVAHVPVPPQSMLDALTAMGISPSAAGGLVEIYQGIDSGRLVPETPPTPESRTHTRFATFVADTMLPALRAARETATR
jgi:uncharacterized protein YbjT (DUF2867 family)